MATWLAPICGVVVVGVVIELLVKDGRLGQFIRAVYGFFVLFVVVSPLPQLFSHWDWSAATNGLGVDEALVTTINQNTRQATIEQKLRALGYSAALVSVQGATVYVNLGVTLSADELAALQNELGTEVVII